MRNSSGPGMKIGLKIAEKLGQKAFGGEPAGRTRKSTRPQDDETGGGSGLLDDVAGMLGGVAGIVMDMRQQVASDFKSRMQFAADRADLATRQDIERLEAMVMALGRRVDALMRGDSPAQEVAPKAQAKAAPAQKTAQMKATPAKTAGAKTAKTVKPTAKPVAVKTVAAKLAPKTTVKTPVKVAQQSKGKAAAKAKTAKAPVNAKPSAKKQSAKPVKTAVKNIQPAGSTTRAQAKQERAALVGAWNARLDALAAKGVSRAKFCADSGVAPAQLSRYMTGTNTPGWGAIEKVEAALAKAGV